MHNVGVGIGIGNPGQSVSIGPIVSEDPGGRDPSTEHLLDFEGEGQAVAVPVLACHDLDTERDAPLPEAEGHLRHGVAQHVEDGRVSKVECFDQGLAVIRCWCGV